MIPPNILNSTVIVKRRNSTGRDSLNNPIYGNATDGAGWSTVYVDMPVRLAFSGKDITFAPEGERILPTGIMYFNPPFSLQNEDRVLTPDGIEYIVIGMTIGYGPVGKVIDHFEAVLQLP